ncbi:MAG: S24/S26 family peptidase [Clostridia bacterium]|nr:S24/S26 family peptidase [Clostridia bacterium]
MANKKILLSDLWPVMEEQIEGGKTVVFSPDGTSMLPLIRPNIDRVVLTKAPKKLKKYDLPLYIRDDGKFILHRVVAVKKSGYVMCGDNQYEMEYGVKDSEILALACGIYRGNEFLSFDDKKYKKYVKIRVGKNQIHNLYIRFKRFAVRVRHKIRK